MSGMDMHTPGSKRVAACTPDYLCGPPMFRRRKVETPTNAQRLRAALKSYASSREKQIYNLERQEGTELKKKGPSFVAAI